MKFLGLDAGSVSVKLVVFDEKRNRLYSCYERHRGHPVSVALRLLKKAVSLQSTEHRAQSTVECLTFNVQRSTKDSELRTPNSERNGAFSLSVTGSAGRLIASILGMEPVNEIVAQAYSTIKLFPHIKTIIELGGEDSKLILIGDGCSIRDFSMNSVCAAGTGSFLDQQAERLRLTIEEFSELALKSKKPPRIAGRCSVFAKSDMIHLQQIATPMEDIVAGLCFAVARNFKGSISRGRDIILPISFQGGVAANKGMVRAFKEIFELDDLFVPEDYALMGAIGAVLKDMDGGIVRHFNPELVSGLEEFVKSDRPIEAGYPPLIDTAKSKEQRAKNTPTLVTCHSSLKTKAYLGIDVGSISTNLAVIDEHGRLLSKRYLMTAGRPIEAVKQGLEEIGEEIGDKVEIMGVGTTGSGRYMIADYVGADIVKNEITAQATAAVFIDRSVDTIFEIGGQDSKYISLKDGVVVDFEMNKACAAGTGSFLEEQAEKLNISIKGEFEECAFASKSPCRLGERCTVFMENSLMANLQKGTDRNNLLAGLAYSIVQNYINRVVAGKAIGRNIFFQGGVAFNKSVVAAFEKYLGKNITVPPHHDVTGAIGMALIAIKYMKEKTIFKGFELSKRPYEISSFECKGCPNICDINRVKIAGEEGYLFYGSRCEKYDVRKNQKSSHISHLTSHDFFSFRDEMLWKAHLERQSIVNPESSSGHQSFKQSSVSTPSLTLPPRGGGQGWGGDSSLVTARLSSPKSRHSSLKIGIPYIFFFHDYLPFWTTLLWELGFYVEVSPKTNRQIINLGLESVLSETCFPVKIAHGHIKYLLDKDIDAIFIPSFINLNTPEDRFERGFACPYTQTIPYVSKIAFKEGIKPLTPVINLRRGRDFLEKEIKRLFKPFGLKTDDIANALDKGEKAQEEFFRQVKSKGIEILSSLKERTIVIIGRAYNAFDNGVTLEIPKKLADLGVCSIPMDFLPIEDIGIDQDWPNMYWRSGQRILSAARFIRGHPNLYALYIGNFSCGPDSFILKYFNGEMEGKPYLFIEIDEHSADAGVITRCEAFLDSIQNKVMSDESRLISKDKSSRDITYHSSLVTLHRMVQGVTHHSKRTIYIPRMSDHAFALAAAFEHCGISAEVLPESDRTAIDIGKKYVSGKECYPCAVTTGDMLKKVMEPDFRPGESAFFMPSGSGPCRFGQYNVFHRLILDEIGYKDVPIFSPNQDVNFYRDLGIVGKDFTLRSWTGIVAIELLYKCLHETRPYEREKGSSDTLYNEYLQKIYRSLCSANGNIEDVLKDLRRDFEHLPKEYSEKPLIGIVGEIFVRSHSFSNENLIRKVEALGGQVWLAPVEEWIYYVNLMGFRKALIKKDWSGMINFLLKKFFQKRIEHRVTAYFKGFLKTLKEPETHKILSMASPYLHHSFEGEAILSIGKSIDLIRRGASGIINAMPFGCMPGTIVTALMRGLSGDYGIPCISIPYDGTESLTTEIQLEAFMDQAKENAKCKIKNSK
ncbi:MAG: CoA protein activase [Nitrospirae bacterium]|nr:CoA protein activase [Nitrospirota bacterium]